MLKTTNQVHYQFGIAMLAVGLLILALPKAVEAVGPLDVHTVNPCRILDTRLGSPDFDRLSSDETLNIFLRDGTFPDQGNTTNCGIPFPGAQGVFINVVAVQPTGASNFLAIYPFGSKQPLASSINYSPDTSALANGIFVSICGESLCDRDLAIYNGTTASVDVVIDVTGYVAKAFASILIDFDQAPGGASILSGTDLANLYASLGVTFEHSGGGALCGTTIYANSNHPGDFGSLPNVVTTCDNGLASDISENSFGLIQANFSGAAQQACIDVRPDGAGDFAVLRAFDSMGSQIGETFSAAGVTETLCVSSPGIRSVRFSGSGTKFARFDNLLVR